MDNQEILKRGKELYNRIINLLDLEVLCSTEVLVAWFEDYDSVSEVRVAKYDSAYSEQVFGVVIKVPNKNGHRSIPRTPSQSNYLSNIHKNPMEFQEGDVLLLKPQYKEALIDLAMYVDISDFNLEIGYKEDVLYLYPLHDVVSIVKPSYLEMNADFLAVEMTTKGVREIDEIKVMSENFYGKSEHIGIIKYAPKYLSHKKDKSVLLKFASAIELPEFRELGDLVFIRDNQINIFL